MIPSGKPGENEQPPENSSLQRIRRTDEFVKKVEKETV